MKKSKKIVLSAAIALAALAVICIGIFAGIYFTRFQTVMSINKLSSYDDGYNLYFMDVKYNYSIDNFLDYDVNSDQEIFDAIIKESLPLLPVKIKTPKFGCTAFNLTTADGDALMGRNYDFKKDTSAMLVRCEPKDGYKSVAFAALDNVSANSPEASIKGKFASLTAPYICLDGINEKGVSIAVLVVDSEPVHQDSGKPNIFTTLAIRIVLDRAATTGQAVDLLKEYDMLASSGKDYHFYINDASGDGRIVEYDCESPTRELVATPVNAVTNFYTIYEDKVLPNQRNGIYGHGKERYYAVLDVLNEQKGNYSDNTAWSALKAASQKSDSESLTSNTQWSIIFNSTDLTAKIVLRRNWGDTYLYDLKTNTVTLTDEQQ